MSMWQTVQYYHGRMTMTMWGKGKKKEDYKWEPGVILRVVASQGSELKIGEFVVVVQDDRFPTLRDKMLKKVGEKRYMEEFCCIQSLEGKGAGFYSKSRFVRAENVGFA